MNTFNTGNRRSLDGPTRRSPASSPALTVSEAPTSEPVRPLVLEQPVFEYKPTRRSRRMSWRYARVIAVILVVLGVSTGGWLGYRGYVAARSIITKSNGGAPALKTSTLDVTQLKGEGDGRINVLMLGIGGAGHEGANLSDTIMVMSVDPKTKDAAMLSIPRDLYVKIPGHGSSKINAANAFGGSDLATKTVESVIGVPIHYYVQVDFSGFKQAVDAVGGIDVTVPTAIYDPTYPCDNERGGFCAFSVKPGSQHMDGTLSLRYARSRHTTSDFDRAARQQLILAALRQKALEASTLTNPVKLSGLIDTVGSHVKTDMQPNEITKMAALAKDIDIASATQKVLDTAGNDSLLVDGSGTIAGAGSIELPRAGAYNYSDIQDFVKNIFVDHYITDENAHIEVQNGSGIAGLATGVVKSLKAAHYNVSDPSNAAEHYTSAVIYDYTGGKKPYTANYLAKRFGVKVQKMSSPSPVADASGNTAAAPQIRIILGSSYQATTSSQ